MPLLTSRVALLERARELAARGPRQLLGITGQPGAGKSTIAALLADELGSLAAVVPMDGFHLPNADLEPLGLRDRKGAPETFDAEGFVELLQTLKAGEGLVEAPSFRRDIEETVPRSIPVLSKTPLVIVEGNYLLLDRGLWANVRGLLDECWYVDAPHDARVERLVARHVAHGKPPTEARAWVMRSDESNARVILETRPRADLVVDIG